MNNDDIGKKARSGVYWSIGLKFAQQLYHFIVMIVVARILGPKAFGIMAIIMTIINYLNSLTGFGLTSAIVQQSEMEERTVSTIFTFNLLLSILIMLGLYGYSEQVALFFNAGEVRQYLTVMALLVPIASFYNIPMAVLRRSMRYKEHSIVDLIQYTSASTIMLVMALLGYGVWSLVVASIAGYIIAGTVLIAYTKWIPRLDFRLSRIYSLFEYGFWDLVRFHINYIEENIANIFISKHLNLVSLGYFERSNSIATIPMRKIQAQINSVVFSALSRLRGDKERLVAAIDKIITMISFMAFPGMVVFALVSPFFVNVCLGEQWSEMTGTLQLLCVLSILRIYSSALNSINVAIGVYRRHTTIGVATSALLIVLCAIGVRFGLNGIIAALFIYTAINVIAYSYVTCKELDLKLHYFFESILRRLYAFVAVLLLYIPYYKIITPHYNVPGMVGVILYLVSIYFLIELFFADRKTKTIFTHIINDFRK